LVSWLNPFRPGATEERRQRFFGAVPSAQGSSSSAARAISGSAGALVQKGSGHGSIGFPQHSGCGEPSGTVVFLLEIEKEKIF
jgi:hypothetical protein